MANIFLRVPTYVAQFYRGREVKNPLSEMQPVEFSPFQHEHVLMSATLQLESDLGPINSACFSQRAWRNIMQGKQPQGGKRILTRDDDQWPTINEICMLTGEKKIQRMDGYDYLCIEMPRQIVVGRQYKQTNPSFTLPPSAATDLQRMLRYEFIRIMLDWIRQERYFCNKAGIRRELAMMVDHFFYHYGMVLGTNQKDRDSMRRMAARWIEDAKMLPNDGVDFGVTEDLDYIYEYEEGNRDVSMDVLLKELKSGVNK